jgi:glycosyltransferase involved in cell wall biosynthesis
VARILIVTPVEVTSDVRVRRRAAAALASGHAPICLCGATEKPIGGEIRGVPIVRVRADRLSGALRRRGLGGLRRSTPLVRELRGAYRLLRLAGLTARFVSAGLRLGSFDVVHANELDALPAGWLLARIRRTRLIYDTGELYTFLEEEPPRIYSVLAGRLERALARAADSVASNSDPYARFLTDHLRLRKPCLVVLDPPERNEDEAPPAPAEGRVRAIYQAGPDQPSRPVSDIVLAAANAPSADVTIRVVSFDRAAIQGMIDQRRLGDRVRIAEPVPPTQLVNALVPFEVGIILRRPLTFASELSLPNKLLEYMTAGLAVIAPRLPGMAPLVEQDKIGLTYAPDSPDELAAALEHLAGNRSSLLAMRRRAWTLARGRYSAEAQLPILARLWGDGA